MSEVGSRSMNEELADVAVPALADTEELLLTSGGVFPRNKSQPCSQIASLLELAPVTDGRKNCGCAQRPDFGDCHEPTGNIFSVCNRGDLSRHLIDALLQPAQVGKQVSEKSAHRRREVVRRIFENQRQVELEQTSSLPQ
ncbi:hypothetical protein ASG57_26310 [Bradyrhizobium sp. Leaf396]|nr:hypothetical protein ASG57_26310 [Bradyrhizobium sp. Leaf396]